MAYEDLVGTTLTQTLTNKTLTLPKINEDVALTATSTELNALDGITPIAESLFDAHTILYAVSDDTPAALAVAASRIVGRKASGNIAAMTGAETLALLTGANLDVGAFDVRGQTVTADGLTSGRVVFAGASGVLSDDGDFLFATDTLTITKIATFEATGLVTSSSTTGYKTTATFVPDSTRTNYAYSIGNRATELTVNLANAASQNFEPFQMNVNLTASGGAPTSTSTVRMIRVRSTHDTVDMANLRIMNVNTYMDVRKNMEAAYGVMHGVDFQTNAVAITTEAAVGVFNMDCVTAVTGNVRGIIINLHGATLPATSVGLEVRTDGGTATLNEGVRIWSVGSCSINYGLYIDGTINTADIRFSGGQVITSTASALTMPTFSLGGTLNTSGQVISGNMRGIAGANFILEALANNKALILGSQRTAANTGAGITLRTYNVSDGNANRLTITSGVDVAMATWSNCEQTLGGKVVLNGQAFDAGSGYAEVNTTGGIGLRIDSTNNSATGVGIATNHISTSPATDDRVFRILAEGYDLDSPQNYLTYGELNFRIEDATADHADGKFEMKLLRDQTPTLAMTVTSLGAVGGDAAYAEFDELDDVKLMVRDAIPQLCDIGVMSRKPHGEEGYMLNFQKAIYLGWGGIKQNRALINTVEYRINQLETELATLKASLN